MFRKISVFGVVLAFLAGCQTSSGYQSVSEYCEERPVICVVIGAVIIGGVVAIAKHHDHDDDNGGGQAVSDTRLKQNARWVGTLENGIRLHAFRYKGDDRMFVGVLAQEIRQMPEFADAVIELENGYLAVDYRKLGLQLVAFDQMQSAGRTALSRI